MDTAKLRALAIAARHRKPIAARNDARITRAHEAAPRNRAELFCSMLRGAWGPIEHRPLDVLGGTPRLPVYSANMLEWFAPPLRQSAGLIETVRFHIGVDPTPQIAPFEQLARDYESNPKTRAKVDANAGQKGAMTWVRDRGLAYCVRGYRGWAICNAAELVHRGYVAEVLDAELAWSLLLEVGKRAQKEFTSFSDLWRATAVGLALRAGETEPEAQWIDADEAYEGDPSNLRKRVPWNTDLDADEPITPPTAFTSVNVRASVECPTCRTYAHVDRLSSELTCRRCETVVELDARALLTDMLFSARVHDDGIWRNWESSDEVRAQRTWSVGAPRCAGCARKLDTRALLGTPPPDELSCDCGARSAVRRPDAAARRVDPQLEWIVGEAENQQEPLRKVDISSVAIGCISCGARIDVDGTQRLPSCAKCGAANFLSAELWMRFHPAPVRRVISFLLQQAATPLDHPTPPAEIFTLEGGLTAATFEHTYKKLFNVHAYQEPRTYAPDGPLTRAERFVLALGAADRHLASVDSMRLGGVPRSLAHRVLAANTLEHRHAIESKKQLTGALAQSKGEPTAQRVRKQLELMRLGFVLGWVSREDFFAMALPVAQRVQSQHASYAEFAKGHAVASFSPASAVELRQACDELLADPCSPWRTVPWSTDLGSSVPYEPTTDEPREWIAIRASVACPHCLASVPIDDLVPRVECPRCLRVVTLAAESWRARLELPVFVAHSLAPRVMDRMTDHRVDGQWAFEVGRMDPRCGNCEAPLAISEKESVVSCSECKSVATLRPASTEDREIEPRALARLTHQAIAEDHVTTLACPACGAGIETEGRERTLVCKHCRTTSWMSDKDWLRFHPAPRRKGFYFLVTKNRSSQGKDTLDDPKLSRSIMVRGAPSVTTGVAK